MALQRETVVRVALTLLSEVGLDGLTVRRLAERLGVQNPALYWHFKNKQDLLNQMAKVMLADAFAGLGPPPANEEWAGWLAEVAGRLRRALLEHRDGARVIAGAELAGSDLLVALDLALRVLTERGFTLHAALVGTVTIFDYTLGAAFEEQAEPAHLATTSTSEPKALWNVLDPIRLPMLAAVLDGAADRFAGDRGMGFEAGLQLILAGMRATKASTDG
jgi:TetR/AcrR family transcriptional regulator, tetracycline repressor protein